jgi:predicted DNA binding protein
MEVLNEDSVNILNLFYNVITESRREAKQLLQQGKLNKQEFDTIVGIDPTEQKKYTGWLARIYVKGEEQNIDNLRNTIEEFDAFVRKGLIKDQKSNIQSYKSFKDLYNIVNELNKTETTASKSELSGDFDVIVDNDDIRIVTPYTHEASRKLGLTPIEKGGFAFRECEGGKKDSAWCTTYSTSTHWDDYYYVNNVDFYYTLIKSDNLKNQLKRSGFDEKHYVVALARILIDDPSKLNQFGDNIFTKKDSEGNLYGYDAYDGTDSQMDRDMLDTWMKIVGIN